jgi:hypothetical protein
MQELTERRVAPSIKTLLTCSQTLNIFSILITSISNFYCKKKQAKKSM